jgi:hypothetical protein
MRANGLFVIEKNRRAHLLMRRKIFRQRRSAALQKISVSPFANRHSLLAAVFTIRHSLFATRRRFAIRCRFPTCRFADFTICR